jgi:signal peptide peptidase SppA
MKAYNRVMMAVYGSIWALEAGKFDDLTAFLELKIAGGVPDDHILAGIRANSEIAAARIQKASASSKGSVAVLSLQGLIMPRANMMGDMSGPRGTSIDQFKAQFRQAMNDPSVKAIVIDVDSPGGSVQGVDELASEILAARGKKEVTAVVSGICASAALYIVSGASKIVASPSSQVGSVGVYGALRDETAKNEKEGVKHTVVTYGANKALGDPRTPTSPTAIADLQESVDAYGGMFDGAMARGRKTTQANVRETYGQGKMFMPKKAKQIGMIDDIGTMDDVLAGYGIDSNAPRQSMLAASEIAAEDPATSPVEMSEDVKIKLAAMSRELELAGA